MTKLSTLALVLGAIAVIANASRTEKMQKKMREVMAAQQARAKTVVMQKGSALRTATAPTYVTIESYADTSCATLDLYFVYGTNLCWTYGGSGSMMYTWTASGSGGTLAEQFYSDSACATAEGSPLTLYTITDTTSCTDSTMYSFSTTLSFPDTDGITTEWFSTSAQCSANTPFMSTWLSTGTLAVDDLLLIYDCTEETFTDDAGGTSTQYWTNSCTGTCSGSGSSSSSCFAGSETVTMESGEIKAISEVVRGDRVLAADANGNAKFSTVVAVPHAANNEAATFTHITAASGADIKMTQDHLLMVSPACSGSAELMAAGSVEAGMCVMTTSAMEKVASVETVNGNGVYTIVTEEEMVVVNGFVASPFATNHAAANAFYNIVRMLPASFLDMTVVKKATEIFGAMAASF